MARSKEGCAAGGGGMMRQCCLIFGINRVEINMNL